MQRPTNTLGLCLLWLFMAGCQLMGHNHPREVVKIKLDETGTQKFTERDYKLAKTYFETAVAALDHDDFRLAETYLHKAINVAPHLSEPHNNLGMIYFRRRKFYEAAQQFQQAIDLNPDFADPYYNLGLVHETADQLPEAILAYQQAVELSPNNPIFLGNYIKARLANNDHSPDIQDLLKQLVFLDSRSEWITWARDELHLWEPSYQYEQKLQQTVGEINSTTSSETELPSQSNASDDLSTAPLSAPPVLIPPAPTSL